MASRGWHGTVLSILWLFWAAVLLSVYYTKVWELFTLGPSTWVNQNYSLIVLRDIWHLVRAGPSAWGLPALGEAVWRALVAIFGWAVVILAAQVLGMGVCKLLRWDPHDWRERLLYQTSIGLGGIAYLSLGLAALSLYSGQNITILLAVVLICGSFWLYSFVSLSGWQRIIALTRSVFKGRHRGKDRVWKAISMLAVLIALVGALAPEKEYDALWYHLNFPRLWLEQGYLVDLPAEFVSLYPMTWGLIFGAGLALGGPIAAKLLHFSCLLLTALVTYALTARFIRGCSPWLAVALFVTVPTVLWEATTAYIDLALAMHVGLTLYALLRYVEVRRWQWLVLAAINLGLALASKHLALFVFALVPSGLALWLWHEERNWRRALAPAVGLGLLSLLVPLPWYIRSGLASGNPVFPALFGIFGASPERWDAITQHGLDHFFARFGRPRTVLNLLTLPWDMTVHGARYGGALGPMFLLSLPMIVFLRRCAENVRWLTSFVFFYLVLWASPFSSFQMRFVVPITPILAVLAAKAFAQLGLLLRTQRIAWGRSALHSGVAVLMMLNLPPFTSLHEVDRVRWDGWLTHVIHDVPIGVVIGNISHEEYLKQFVPSYDAWRYINAHLPSDARVLTFTGGDHLYSKRGRIWSDATIARPAVWGAPRGKEQQALRTMLQLRITHVLFDKRQIESLDHNTLAIAHPSVLSSWYDREYEDRRFALFRVRWDWITSEQGIYRRLTDEDPQKLTMVGALPTGE